jgi:hypothetical protein
MELRTLFDGVIATGEGVFEVTSIERESSLVGGSESIAISDIEDGRLSRKRSASGSLSQYSERRSKKASASEQISLQLSEMAAQMAALVATMKTDHQKSAIKDFMEHFGVLDAEIQITVIEAFEKEFTAKSYVLMTRKMQKRWVRNELYRRRDQLKDAGLDIDALLGSTGWQGDGDLILTNSIDSQL